MASSQWQPCIVMVAVAVAVAVVTTMTTFKVKLTMWLSGYVGGWHGRSCHGLPQLHWHCGRL